MRAAPTEGSKLDSSVKNRQRRLAMTEQVTTITPRSSSMDRSIFPNARRSQP
jgi:hypothetical protein